MDNIKNFDSNLLKTDKKKHRTTLVFIILNMKNITTKNTW